MCSQDEDGPQNKKFTEEERRALRKKERELNEQKESMQTKLKVLEAKT